MKSLQAPCAAERGPLMSRDVKTTTQIEGPSSTTRGIADCLLSEMWFLRAQGRGGCSRVLIVPLQDVRVEDENCG